MRKLLLSVLIAGVFGTSLGITPNLSDQGDLGHLGVATAYAAAKSTKIVSPGQHCVAYKVQKRLFLVHTVDVVGKNCNISSQIIPAMNGQYYVEIVIPIKGFESHESERDRDVEKLLKGESHPQMVYKSSGHTKAEWTELFKQKSFPLNGTLSIGIKTYPVVAQNQLINPKTGPELAGTIVTKFADLNIDPPSFAFGLAAKVKPMLEFHFNFLGQKTLGLEAILPGETAEL